MESAGPVISWVRGIFCLFLREKFRFSFLPLSLSFSLSVSLFLSFLFSQSADSGLRLSLSLLVAFNFSNDLLLRNAGNWHSREMREKQEKSRKRFYDNKLYVILYHVCPLTYDCRSSRSKDRRQVLRTMRGGASWKCKRCLSSDKKSANFFHNVKKMWKNLEREKGGSKFLYSIIQDTKERIN